MVVIPFAASFVEVMHEAVKNSRDLIVLFTRDYEQSPYTRKEFTSFEAERAQSAEERHIIVLRCEDAPLRGLLADSVCSPRFNRVLFAGTPESIGATNQGRQTAPTRGDHRDALRCLAREGAAPFRPAPSGSR